MREETAQVYNLASRSGVSSSEAWEDLQLLAEVVDWDVERMLSDSDSDIGAVSDHERPR